MTVKQITVGNIKFDMETCPIMYTSARYTWFKRLMHEICLFNQY